MRHRALVFLAALALSACAGKAKTTAPARAAAPAEAPLGSVDGAPIGIDDLDRDVRTRLGQLDNEAAQKRLQLLWMGLEEVVGRRLLDKEAQRRGVSLETLREQEILSKVTPPTEEEIQQFYDQNADRIGVDYKTAFPHIKNELTAERARAIERSLVERLREQTPVKYDLPIPELQRQKLEIGAGPSWGKKDAKVTIVEFSDFQCPFCARASVIIKRLRELYPNDLRVEYRDFPLAQHPDARGAAEAGRCADEQGKFWEYHDLLFANARALRDSDLKKYASEASLDVQAFSTCLGSDKVKNAVEKSLALGTKAGVEGTPAIWINGIKLVGLLPLPLMQAFIDKELGRP